MGRLENNATPNQACSNLVPPPPTEQYHTFVASNRYTAIAQTQSSLNRHLAFTHIACTPNRFEAGFKPPPGSDLRNGVIKFRGPHENWGTPL